MDPQNETSSIRSADRRSLLKAWGELDIGFSEGPVDYLWLFYTAFYTAKGIPRAKTFYVSRLSIWKEPGLRMSFYHEYLVATIRSENRTDKREYYLLFERTAGQLNTDKKTEEDFGDKAGQKDDEQKNEGDMEDFSFAPDRNLEDKIFGVGPQHWGDRSDDEGGPRSANAQGSSSPKSDGMSGMLGMLFAAKDLASNASESSSKDLILADDRYQLIDRPYRRSSDIEVAWIVLGRPNGPSPDSAEKQDSPIDGPTKKDPTSDTAPNSPSSQHGQGTDALYASSRVSVASNNAPGVPTSSAIPARKVASSPPSILTVPQDIPDIEVRRRTESNVSQPSHLPYTTKGKHPMSVPSPTSIGPSGDLEPPGPFQPRDRSIPLAMPSSGTEVPPSTFLDQLPFSKSDIEEIPVASAPRDGYPDTRFLSDETFQFTGPPLLRLRTNLSQTSAGSHGTNISRVTRSSRFRLRRKHSFSTIHYDALPLLPSRKHIYLYELIALACRLHKCTSLYRIFTRNCYWFAGMIFHVIRVFTKTDASITGEGETIDRMKPSTEVMLWINSGRLGTFLRSIRIVKAPRLFTVYALIRKWHGAISRFEDQVNVNFADNTPQQMRVIQLAIEAEIRKRKAAEAEAERNQRAREEAEAGVDKKVEEARKEVGAELGRQVQEVLEAERKEREKERREHEEERREHEEERKRLEDERREHEEERKRLEDERKKREEVESRLEEERQKLEEERRKREELERRLEEELERRMEEYKMALRARAKTSKASLKAVDDIQPSDSPSED